MKVNPHRSSLNIDANMLAMLLILGAAILSTIPFLKYFAWALPLVFFFVEKQSPFVKVFAMQAVVIYVPYAILQLILLIIRNASLRSIWYYASYGGGYWFAVVFGWILFVLFGAMAVILMIKAYGYFEYKLPVVGNLAEKIRKSFKL